MEKGQGKRPRGRLWNEVTTSHRCNAPFYIFRFPENVHVGVFANCQVDMLYGGIFNRVCLDSGECHCEQEMAQCTFF